MMPTSLILAVASACMAAAAAVPSPSFTYPQGVTVTEYPNGLPEELKPTENNSTELSLEKRASAGVYFCTDRNFAGFCAHIFAEEYTCVNLGPDLDNKVSSVGPDAPKFCLFYDNFNCKDDEGHFAAGSPGYTDLSSSGAPGPYWNDRIGSFVCHPR